MPTLMLHGRLVSGGTPCQRMIGDDGTTYALIGNLGGFASGAVVHVAGDLVGGTSPCGDSVPTVLVSWIGKELSPTQEDKRYVRDIRVTATYSTYDDSPSLKLEGREQTLAYDNTQGCWLGIYKAFQVTNKLDILFVSEGWKGQVLELGVEAKDPKDPAQTKSKTYSVVVDKGAAVIKQEMEV